jgi:hypothetical protein
MEVVAAAALLLLEKTGQQQLGGVAAPELHLLFRGHQ